MPRKFETLTELLESMGPGEKVSELNDCLNVSTDADNNVSVDFLCGADIKIKYDLNAYRENPKKYLKEQAESHKEYNDMLIHDHGEMHNTTLIGKIDSLRREIEFPGPAAKLLGKVSRMVCYPICWAHLKSPEGFVKHTVDSAKGLNEDYAFERSIFNYGADFFDYLSAKECKGAAKDVVYSYSSLIGSVNHFSASTKDFFAAVFPEKSFK